MVVVTLADLRRNKRPKVVKQYFHVKHLEMLYNRFDTTLAVKIQRDALRNINKHGWFAVTTDGSNYTIQS